MQRIKATDWCECYLRTAHQCNLFVYPSISAPSEHFVPQRSIFASGFSMLFLFKLKLRETDFTCTGRKFSRWTTGSSKESWIKGLVSWHPPTDPLLCQRGSASSQKRRRWGHVSCFCLRVLPTRKCICALWAVNCMLCHVHLNFQPEVVWKLRVSCFDCCFFFSY